VFISALVLWYNVYTNNRCYIVCLCLYITPFVSKWIRGFLKMARLMHELFLFSRDWKDVVASTKPHQMWKNGSQKWSGACWKQMAKVKKFYSFWNCSSGINFDHCLSNVGAMTFIDVLYIQFWQWILWFNSKKFSMRDLVVVVYV